MVVLNSSQASISTKFLRGYNDRGYSDFRMKGGDPTTGRIYEEGMCGIKCYMVHSVTHTMGRQTEKRWVDVNTR